MFKFYKCIIFHLMDPKGALNACLFLFRRHRILKQAVFKVAGNSLLEPHF